MDQYYKVSSAAAAMVTKAYSTSFSMAILGLSKKDRRAIYDIYGLVRVADEIVDTYDGPDKSTRLNELKEEVARAIKTGYSTNLIVQAFANTAKEFDIQEDLFGPFFDSMEMDVAGKRYDEAGYKRYIYGSACVVGLMCLKVFVLGDKQRYAKLSPGATALGSAFQKVNFLRDFADDTQRLGRSYFPNVTGKKLNKATKAEIIDDIKQDFSLASAAIKELPRRARIGVYAAERYYQALLTKLEQTPASDIMLQRVRINNARKIIILAVSWLRLGK